jgi:tetratricopeptide (TPR) repeat protein
MIFLAIYAVDAFCRNRRRWVTVSIFLVGFPLLYIQNNIMKDEMYQVNQATACEGVMIEAVRLREAGDLEGAAAANAMGYALAPWNSEGIRLAGVPFSGATIAQRALGMALWQKEQAPSRLFDLAVLYTEAGRLDEAEPIFRYLAGSGFRFNRQYNQSSEADFYLARICQQKGQAEKAVFHLERALENNPGDPWVLSHLWVLT